jgi:drug/metabolite transporter (DMT)-like permease
MFGVCIAGCIELLTFYIYESFTYMTMPTNWVTIMCVTVLGLVTSLIQTYWWNSAVSVVGVNRSAIFVNLIPVFGATLATIFLNEQIYFIIFLAQL